MAIGLVADFGASETGISRSAPGAWRGTGAIRSAITKAPSVTVSHGSGLAERQTRSWNTPPISLPRARSRQPGPGGDGAKHQRGHDQRRPGQNKPRRADQRGSHSVIVGLYGRRGQGDTIKETDAMRSMDEMDRSLQAATRTGAIPGVVAACATATGPLVQIAHGRRVLPDGAPMTLDTVFRIASMTKAITATAAMQLVEQGRLALDAPAGEVVPALAEVPVLEGFDAAGAPRLRPARTPITLRRLLTHTAGFGYDTWNADLHAYAAVRGVPPARTGKLAALAMPLTFDPGTAWQYGINIDWAGRMVEAASGLDLETYFQRHICGPLGMTDTSFLVRPDMEARLASVHARRDGGLEPLRSEINPAREFYPGGGGLYATMPDYLRLLRMLLRGGELDGARVLAPATVALMGQNHIGALEVQKMRSVLPAMSNDFEAFPGMAKKWGLSFMLNTEPVAGGRAAGSLAWAGLNNTYFWLDPQAGLAGVVMTQVLPFGDPMVLGLLGAFEQAAYRALGDAPGK